MTTLPEAEPLDAEAVRAGRIGGLVASMRPRQWIKNLACFAGLIFSGHLFEAPSIRAAAWAFAGFCLASSSVYLVNDVFDRRSDAANPKKRSRPIASGRLPVGMALAASGVLAAAALGSSLILTPGCRAVLTTYLVMGLAYSARLKHTVLLDVMIIAVGFVLRILYGAFAVGVPATPWIVLCMFFLALFLGFAKRRSELARLGLGGPGHRPVLIKYRTGLLDLLLAMTATMAIICYALYTVIGRPESPGHETLVVTVPVVVYGICRYLLIVIVFDLGDAPEKDVVDDLPLIVAVGIWVALCVLILYMNINFIHLIGPPRRGPRRGDDWRCAACAGREDSGGFPGSSPSAFRSLFFVFGMAENGRAEGEKRESWAGLTPPPAPPRPRARPSGRSGGRASRRGPSRRRPAGAGR